MAKKNRHKNGLGQWLALALVFLLLAGLVLLAGVRYAEFVSRTVYRESVSHLGEMLHQSTTMFNDLVQKNIAYLHMWGRHLAHTTDEAAIRLYVEEAQEETGFHQFYFLSSEGYYMTPAGDTGYLGLQGNLEDQGGQGDDAVMTAALPGKPQMLVLVCPDLSGVYQGFAYDAIAVSYYNEDIVKILDISAFDGATSSYVIHADGRVVIDNAAGEKETVYNFLAMLRDYSDLSQEQYQALAQDFREGHSGNRMVRLGGTRYYLLYEQTSIEDWIMVGLVPADIVNAGMNDLQAKTILLVSVVVTLAAAIVIYVILRKSNASLRRKDREILYRDELFEKLSLNVDDVFLMLDTNTNRADYVSPNAERLLGLTAESIKEDIRIMERLNPENTTAHKADYLYRLVAREQREWDYAYLHQKTGERRWFHIVAMGTEVAGRQKYILVLSDRTEDKRRNQALQEAVSAAESANRAKSTFLSNMSHDIRTPMNAIVGFSVLAINNMDSKERVRDYLEKILSSSNHLLSLINDILDMSRIESGKIQLEETEVNLFQILKDIKAMLSGQVQTKQLKLYVEAEDVWNEDVYCDKTRLNQVLLNLLSNAVKFTPAGGNITLRLRQLPGTENGRGSFEFRIIDNGIGMSPEFAQRIFEPFERERNSTVSRIQGTGLGMAIAKNIVDLMGGTIEVHSQPNKGTAFVVHLPLTIQEEKPHRQQDNQGTPETPEKPDFTGKRILLAEDNALNQEIALTILSQYGFTVDPVQNGAEAVDRLRTAPAGTYDLVIMDVQMPIMDGYTATKQIRQMHNPIPILAMTANAFEEDRKKAMDAGMNGFLSKPIVIEELVKALTKVLKNS